MSSDPIFNACEICNSRKDVIFFLLGGRRPRTKGSRNPVCEICVGCFGTLQALVESGAVKLRTSDTSNTRFNRVKAAVRRERFGRQPAVLEAVAKDQKFLDGAHERGA